MESSYKSSKLHPNIDESPSNSEINNFKKLLIGRVIEVQDYLKEIRES